jgi:hypothetical protein
MPNDHSRAVARALRANDEIGALFNRLGHSEAPRGALIRAYRTVLRELRGRLDDADYVRAALADFVESATTAAGEVFRAGIDLGEEQGNDMLSIWGLEPVALTVSGQALTAAQASVRASTTKQASNVLTLLSLGADAGQVLGDAGRVGVLQYGTTFAESTRWAVRLTNVAAADTMTQGIARAAGLPTPAQGGDVAAVKRAASAWGRQAIAALDLRTTSCCLRVHGQIVPVDGMFELTGTPRFADNMDAPPFHYGCRTAIALVRLDAQDEALNARLRLDANREATAHEEGGTAQGKYASATLNN